MTIPKKKTRLIEVNDVKYRWMTKHGKHFVRGQSNPTIQLTVQVENENPGRVLTCDLLSKKENVFIEWENCRFNPIHKVSLFPKDIRKVILFGLKNGWNPNEKGPAYKCDNPELTEYY